MSVSGFPLVKSGVFNETPNAPFFRPSTPLQGGINGLTDNTPNGTIFSTPAPHGLSVGDAVAVDAVGNTAFEVLRKSYLVITDTPTTTSFEVATLPFPGFTFAGSGGFWNVEPLVFDDTPDGEMRQIHIDVSIFILTNLEISFGDEWFLLGARPDHFGHITLTEFIKNGDFINFRSRFNMPNAQLRIGSN